MNIKRIKDNVEYLKEFSLDTDKFLCDIAAYMEQVAWTWFDYDHIPVKKEIAKEFYKLLDSLSETNTYVETRGFKIVCDEETGDINCSFIGKFGNKLIATLSTNPYCGDDVMKFIEHLCREYPILNKEWLVEKYKEWK